MAGRSFRFWTIVPAAALAACALVSDNHWPQPAPLTLAGQTVQVDVERPWEGLRSLEAFSSHFDREIIEWAKANAARLAPPILAHAAERQYHHHPADAVAMLQVALLRARYDSLRCRDKNARARADKVLDRAPRAALSLEENPENWWALASSAFAWEAKLPADTHPGWICAETRPNGARALALVPVETWPGLREKLRAEFRAELDKAVDERRREIWLRTGR